MRRPDNIAHRRNPELVRYETCVDLNRLGCSTRAATGFSRGDREEDTHRVRFMRTSMTARLRRTPSLDRACSVPFVKEVAFESLPVVWIPPGRERKRPFGLCYLSTGDRTAVRLRADRVRVRQTESVPQGGSAAQLRSRHRPALRLFTSTGRRNYLRHCGCRVATTFTKIALESSQYKRVWAEGVNKKLEMSYLTSEFLGA
jgi:hypothetical protein